MFKNVASQKLIVYAFDSTTNLPKTGDAANITAYVSKDYGTVTVLGDTSATEMDATNAKGYYLFDLTQGETNADTLLFTAKSSTANIVVIGAPATVFTVPPNFTTFAIDASGRIDIGKALGTAVTLDSNNVLNVSTKYLAGTALTGRDIGASVLLSSGSGAGQLDFTSGVVKANATQWLGGTIPAVNVTGVPLVDLKYTLGTISPATAGSVRADSVTGAVGSVTGSVGSVTGAVGSVTAGVTVTTNNDKTGYTVSTVSDKTGYSLSSAGVGAIFTTQLTEAYAAVGVVPTCAQILFESRALQAEKAVASTTLTTHKIDGSTTAATYTLSDAVNPVSITRAT